MRLHRLTGLEQEKLTEEYRQLLETIAGLWPAHSGALAA
jgi:DNA gyrase subunit A